MSANNYLQIIRPTKKRWSVLHKDIDTNAIHDIKDAKSLADACKIANDWMEEECIEYGLRGIEA